MYCKRLFHLSDAAVGARWRHTPSPASDWLAGAKWAWLTLGLYAIDVRTTCQSKQSLDAAVSSADCSCNLAPSTPATMSKRHCRMLQVERFFRQSRMLLRHCCRWTGLYTAGSGWPRSVRKTPENIRPNTVQDLVLGGGAENAGVENAGVENTGAKTHEKPSIHYRNLWRSKLESGCVWLSTVDSRQLVASPTELTGLVPRVGVIHFDVEADSDSGAQKLRVFIILLYSIFFADVCATHMIITVAC